MESEYCDECGDKLPARKRHGMSDRDYRRSPDTNGAEICRRCFIKGGHARRGFLAVHDTTSDGFFRDAAGNVSREAWA